MLSDVVYFAGHGSGEQAHLHLLRHKLEYIINLVFEAAREHLVGLVQHEHLDVRHAEGAAVDHIVNTAGGTDDNVDAFLQLADVVSHVGASDAGVALRLHEVAELDDHFLDLLGQLAGGREEKGLAGAVLDVDTLQHTDGEGRGLASSTLSLANRVATQDEGTNALLLDGGRLFKTVGINAAEEVFVELESIEGFNCVRPVALNVSLVKGSIECFGHFESFRRGVVCLFWVSNFMNYVQRNVCFVTA